MTEPRGANPRWRWEWLVVPAVAGAASALLSWERWIRPFVDGSRELQVPARVAGGERLYRDVAYYYGPAAPWANGAALEIFGRRFAVLVAMGAVAAAVLSLRALPARAPGRLAALGRHGRDRRRGDLRRALPTAARSSSPTPSRRSSQPAGWSS